MVLAHGIIPCSMDLPLVEIFTIGLPMALLSLKAFRSRFRK